MSELRWNALLGEWTVTATHRQERTFFPPADYCPLCPTKNDGFPTEIPLATFDMVVFQNLFPSFRLDPAPPAVESRLLAPVRAAFGACEVVVYTAEHDGSLVDLGARGIERLVRVWQHRTAALSTVPGIAAIMPFENRGNEVGVTMTHPHGQIYAYPFVPPRLAAELANARDHGQRTGECLFCSVLASERADGNRVVGENAHWTAYIPFAARWPYETHVVARRHLPQLTNLRPTEVRALGELLAAVLHGFDRLFERPFPYIMAVHQAPTDPATFEFAHLHIEFYPPLRTATKLKFLAGSETGAGLFINDTLPETSAALLRQCVGV